MLQITYWVIVGLILFAIIELLRRKVLREKFAIVWLVTGLTFILGAIFPNVVNQISKLLGFQILSNFILFVLGVINLFISMQLSLSAGKAENQIQTLAEEIAILKQKIDE